MVVFSWALRSPYFTRSVTTNFFSRVSTSAMYDVGRKLVLRSSPSTFASALSCLSLLLAIRPTLFGSATETLQDSSLESLS